MFQSVKCWQVPSTCQAITYREPNYETSNLNNNNGLVMITHFHASDALYGKIVTKNAILQQPPDTLI